MISSVTPTSFSRPLWAEVSLDALLHNVNQLHKHSQALVLPVLKSNAYGHGVTACANVLQKQMKPREMFCVASVDEGIHLRNNGITAPVLLLSALLPTEADTCLEYSLTATVSSTELARALNAAAAKRKTMAAVHFKIDSGMGRLGASPSEAVDLWRQLQQLSHLRVVGAFTHFACADEENDTMTPRQNRVFTETLSCCGINWKENERTLFLHAANSAAAWRYHEIARFDAVRPGIAMYGVSPFTSKVLLGDFYEKIIPVMSLQARITSIKNVPIGATVSYGATWKSQRQSRLAVIPCGYADGYHRSLSNRGKVLLRGQLCPIVGRVTMDQIIIDVTDLSPAVRLGESVTLWGRGLPVETVADWAGTIAYELLTNVAPRVPRIYQLSDTN